MRVRSLFFASYRDLLGVDQLEFELDDGVTVSELARVVREWPGGSRLPENPVVAVNREYVPPETRLQDGDEVAFIPPVAGG